MQHLVLLMTEIPKHNRFQIKPIQNDQADFKYFLLKKVYRLINKVINVVLCFLTKQINKF